MLFTSTNNRYREKTVFELQDFLRSPLDPTRATNARERQDEQWQQANTALDAAGAALAAGDHQAAIAASLIGLLALQLSRT